MPLIFRELKKHLPFTFFGALTGIVLAFFYKDVSCETAHRLFYLFHPLHLFLSAIVTSSLYRIYLGNGPLGLKGFIKVFAVGFTGSIVIGTLSDSLIPFWGESLLGMPHSHLHLGFIDKWWLINPVVIVAVIIAYKFPKTKMPHSAHVLVSTWASLFHMLMAAASGQPLPYFGIFIFLFLAVWIPCCLSDIVFPLLFIDRKKDVRKI